MNKNKTFDCVRMKTESQETLKKEYNACKDRYASYADFIRETALLSSEVRAVRDKILKAKARP